MTDVAPSNTPEISVSELSAAIKRARFLGLLPFVIR